MFAVITPMYCILTSTSTDLYQKYTKTPRVVAFSSIVLKLTHVSTVCYNDPDFVYGYFHPNFMQILPDAFSM